MLYNYIYKSHFRFMLKSQMYYNKIIEMKFIILSLFCYFSFLLSFMMRDLYMLIIFLTFSVCEGVLELSCLVMLIRSHGNNNLLSINLLTCYHLLFYVFSSSL